MNRLAQVRSSIPLEVQFYGDIKSVGIDLTLDGYQPVVGDIVWMVELAEAQWMCVGRVRG